MTRGVRLERLPAGLQFPAELAGRISYSAAQQQLQYVGFMGKTDFDKLVRLHNDLAYQRALEQLFQICTFTGQVAPEAGRRRPLLMTSVAAVAFVATMVLAAVLWRHHEPVLENEAPLHFPSEEARAEMGAG